MQHFVPIKVHSGSFFPPLFWVASVLGSYKSLTRQTVCSPCSVLNASAQYAGTTALVELSVPSSGKHYIVLSWVALQGSRLLSWDFSPLQTHQKRRESDGESQVGEKWQSAEHYELHTTRWQCITSSAGTMAAWCDRCHAWCWENISLRRVIVRPHVTDRVRESTCSKLHLATLTKHMQIQPSI